MSVSEELKVLSQSTESSINQNISGLRSEVNVYCSKLRECKKRCSFLESENKYLKVDISLLKKEINSLTNKEWEKNIMIFNVKDEDEVNNDPLGNISVMLKDCEIDISIAWRKKRED